MRRLRQFALAAAVTALGAAAVTGCSSASSPPAGGGKLTIGVPGIPPVFVNLMFYVAQDKGYFASRGLHVRIRALSTGTDVGRAVQSGELNAGMVGTTGAVALRSQGASVVGILGAPNADYLIASDDSAVTGCASLKGKTIGVDATAAPKALALGAMLSSCHLSTKDVTMVNLGGPQDVDALIAGQVKTAVLHTDELAAVLQHKHTVRSVLTSTTADPLEHYAMLITRQNELTNARSRAELVKTVAALHQAISYIDNPANLTNVAATAAAMTKEPASVTAAAITAFVKIGFWPADDGLAANRISHVITQQVAAANISATKAPTAAKLVDATVFRDAVK